MMVVTIRVSLNVNKTINFVVWSCSHIVMYIWKNKFLMWKTSSWFSRNSEVFFKNSWLPNSTTNKNKMSITTEKKLCKNIAHRGVAQSSFGSHSGSYRLLGRVFEHKNEHLECRDTDVKPYQSRSRQMLESNRCIYPRKQN